MSWLEESFKPIWEKYKIEVVLIATASIITIVSGIIFTLSQRANLKQEIPSLIKQKTSVQNNNKISVDLSGAVEKSDVYEVSSGARLKDILILAGGLSQDADRQFFSKNFNLARLLKDQEKIYIPTEEEIQGGEIQNTQNSFSDPAVDVLGASNKVNINSGSMDQLDTLPGVGKVTAGKIIQNRPYASIDDLLNKKIVGKSVFEKIKDLVQL
ncbi:hypothetical protein A2954_00015 [Candidatus Roizmanbacteria bacterium RIFCSPLOWO2_01_FULL_37_12]|uniref:Soluble ligand binding domain-containing protein n=1 Tax=Candidatus Roizmanbacteria bacterium RIFCSPLOWO2_01_FULL_37_12 TaxID=1802056 RepID=A0A1F7IBD8_9BACT|nr:MAG: hypothetical protein A2954_00015 [Candidatus Roizmanbacteria bacterium RIFCSPLOWO2_01_FULL_37_12]